MFSQLDSYLSTSLNGTSRINILLCSIPIVSNRMMEIAENIYLNKLTKIFLELKPITSNTENALAFRERFLRWYELGFCAQSVIAIAAFAALLFTQPLSLGAYVFFGGTCMVFGASSHDAFFKYRSTCMRSQI